MQFLLRTVGRRTQWRSIQQSSFVRDTFVNLFPKSLSITLGLYQWSKEHGLTQLLLGTDYPLNLRALPQNEYALIATNAAL
jgi:hypothetical protein